MKLSRIGIAAALLLAANALAQVSGKPVQMISGYAPGGNVDILARLFAEKWGEAIGRPVVVVNRVGAGGQIGLEMVKAAPPDGNMLIVTPDSSLVLRPLMMKAPPYDPLKDFAAVAHAGEQDYVFAIGGGIPARDLREFATWAKANPAQANFGAGQGGSTQFIGILIGQAIGVPLQTIPYTGSGQIITALLAGQIASAVQPLGTVLALAQAGKIRLVATTGAKRAPESPATPTMAELGHPSLTVASWFGIFAPPGTPGEIVSQLNGIFLKAVRTEAMKGRLDKLGLHATELTPAQLAALVKADYERWIPAIKASGLSLQ